MAMPKEPPPIIYQGSTANSVGKRMTGKFRTGKKNEGAVGTQSHMVNAYAGFLRDHYNELGADGVLGYSFPTFHSCSPP